MAPGKFHFLFFLLFVQKFSVFAVDNFSYNTSDATGITLEKLLTVSSVSEQQLLFVIDEQMLSQLDKPHPLMQLFKKKQKLSKKLTAAALAFPFPFGIVGLHRIYLGCSPYIPVVYIASLGGVFGLLPLIDCIVILCTKDVEQFVNNKKVFMWIE